MLGPVVRDLQRNDDELFDEVTLTDSGNQWGLTQSWKSMRPSSGGTTQLASVPREHASAAYHLDFAGPPLSGFGTI